MSLQPGTRLGPYEVAAKIGEGGMGEVYRATDTKLDRDVALKVLPDLFTSDPDRLARFEREAKVLASLNHPNIGHIYGLEEAEPSTAEGQRSGPGAVKALVLELVEGPTLADRIAQGPIPVDEALAVLFTLPGEPGTAENNQMARPQHATRNGSGTRVRCSPVSRMRMWNSSAAAPCGPWLASGERDSLVTRCGHQAFVERNQGNVLLELLPKVQATGELDGIACAKPVATQQALRPRHDVVREFHDEHCGQVGLERRQRPFTIAVGNGPFPSPTRQGRGHLNRRISTRRRQIGCQEATHLHAALLAHIALRERAGVEIPHQNRSSRPSTTAVESGPPRLSTKRKGTSPSLVGRVTTPFASSSIRTDAIPASPPIGRNSATGCPRSVTMSLCPCRTRRR